jgi:hypothetical protein
MMEQTGMDRRGAVETLQRAKTGNAGDADAGVMIDVQGAINKGARSDNKRRKTKSRIATYLRITGSPLFCC